MIYKRGSIYWTKFQHNGRMIYRSTGQTSSTKARQCEARLRSELAMGNFGILERKAQPTLREFLERDYRPYIEAKHAAKPGTVEGYKAGVRMILAGCDASLLLDQVNDQTAQQIAAKYAHLSASRVNCALRVLRNALNLAVQWGKLAKPVKITLAKGERQRERVLTEAELEGYLAACDQPWRDCATIIADEGMRPSEVFAMRWESIALNGHGGWIRILQGKSAAARRTLPMTPRIYTQLLTRFESAGHPASGLVFATASGAALSTDGCKYIHRRAVERAKLAWFEPYVLRHTMLTRLARHTDPFTVMRVAGHSSISMTQRYCHVPTDAIERGFERMAAAQIALSAVDGGVGLLAGRPVASPLLNGSGDKSGDSRGWLDGTMAVTN